MQLNLLVWVRGSSTVKFCDVSHSEFFAMAMLAGCFVSNKWLILVTKKPALGGFGIYLKVLMRAKL